jgi:hypothetical protein
VNSTALYGGGRRVKQAGNIAKNTNHKIYEFVETLLVVNCSANSCMQALIPIATNRSQQKTAESKRLY